MSSAALLDLDIGPKPSRKERAAKTVNAALRGGLLAGAVAAIAWLLAVALSGTVFFLLIVATVLAAVYMIVRGDKAKMGIWGLLAIAWALVIAERWVVNDNGGIIVAGAAWLGVVIGAWMYSPSKRYRYAGMPSSIPYRGQKRWHTVLGLIFGVATITWAFSGMLSMDPFPSRETGGGLLERGIDQHVLTDALRGRAPLAAFAARDPRDVLTRLGAPVKQLELTSFAGEPIYLATLAPGDTRIVPVNGDPAAAFDHQRIIDIVKSTAGPGCPEVDNGA